MSCLLSGYVGPKMVRNVLVAKYEITSNIAQNSAYNENDVGEWLLPLVLHVTLMQQQLGGLILDM